MADITLEISNSAWATLTAYVANQYVSNDSRDYVCISGHTSGATTEPGTGASWTTYWRQSDAKKTLMLARDNGIAMWKSYEVAQDGGNQDKPIWSQTDWSGGVGEGNFNDPTRYSIGSTIDTSHPGYLCLGPYIVSSSLNTGTLSGYPRSFCKFRDALYMCNVLAVYKWDTTNSYWVSKKACAASGLCVHDGYMYVACGFSYYYTPDGDTYTEVAKSAYGFVSAPPYAGNTPVLWVIDGTNTIASGEAVSGVVGLDDWETDIYVGDSSAAIGYYYHGTGLFIHQGQLMIGKTDGLYHYDSDGVVHKLLNIDTRTHNAAFYPFKAVTQLRGATYFDTGTGIGELTSYNSYDRIEPIRTASDVDIKEGQIYGLANDGENLYASFYASGASTIYKGVALRDSDGNSKWSWHPIAATTGALFALHVPPSPDYKHPRLWMGLQNSTTYTCQYLVLAQNPTAASFAYSDSPSFTSSGYIETGWIDLGHRDWYKIVDSVLAECKMNSGDMSATKYVKLYYATDDSTTFTAIDTTVSTATMGSKKYMDTAPAAFKKIKFKIYLASDSTTVTPIVKYVAAYGSVRPNRVTLMDFTITAEEGHSASSKGLRDFLIHCRDSTGLHTLTDRFGASHYVRILPGYPTETEYLDSSRKQPALGLRLICEKVDWS